MTDSLREAKESIEEAIEKLDEVVDKDFSLDDKVNAIVRMLQSASDLIDELH